MTSAPDVNVTNNKEAQRYEASLPDGLAFAEYQAEGTALVFTHTEVPETLEGQGIGSALVKGALDDVRAQGLQVIPMCPFVVTFIKRHPEYGDLLPEGQRAQFGL